MKPAPHIRREYWERINKKIFLHHSWNFIQSMIKPMLGHSQEFYDEDYPMMNGTYFDTEITLVATRMGIDESLNIVDQLIELGANIFIKLGSFVAFKDEIDIGDIYVPKEAVRLPGTIDAILKYGEKTFANESLLTVIEKIGSQNGTPITISNKVLTCPLYAQYIRDDVVDPKYSIDYWNDECFGDEMECSAIFAVTKARGKKSAAILVCNRRWAVLDGHRKGKDVDWDEHKNSQRYKYEKGYKNAIILALDSLVD